MEFNRACYSISKLRTAADMVKNTAWTVQHKKEHFSKYTEIAKVFEFAAENINRFLFDPDIELKEYKNAAFHYKEYSKRELDQMLKQKYLYICGELNSIKTMIAAGEVDQTE